MMIAPRLTFLKSGVMCICHSTTDLPSMDYCLVEFATTDDRFASETWGYKCPHSKAVGLPLVVSAYERV